MFFGKVTLKSEHGAVYREVNVLRETIYQSGLCQRCPAFEQEFVGIGKRKDDLQDGSDPKIFLDGLFGKSDLSRSLPQKHDLLLGRKGEISIHRPVQ